MIPPAFTITVAGVLGLVIGSFLNVVVWRVPRGESVAVPPSACPACGHPIRARDNVPVVSWLVLRARCRDCRAPISVRYPLVEAGTGIVFALTAWRFLNEPWSMPVFGYLAAIGVALALIDVDVRRLPDSIVLPSYGVVALLLAVGSWGTHDWGALLRALIGGAALFSGYFAIAVARPGGMGFGDVKLAGLLGAATAWLGWGAFAIGAFAAFLTGGLFGIVLLASRRSGRRSAVPFGPWMILGAAIGVAAGEQVWSWYLALLT